MRRCPWIPLLLQASAVLVLLLVVLSTAADALGPSRKLAQGNVMYYEKSKCSKGTATFDFEDDTFVCNKGNIACCGRLVTSAMGG